MEQITSQSGVVNFSSTEVRVDGKPLITKEEAAKKNSFAILASTNIDCSARPKVVVMDNSNSYDSSSGLVKVKTLSDLINETIVGVVETTINSGSSGYAVAKGVITDNGLTGGSVNQSVYVDSSGNLTLTRTNKKIGILITNSAPVKVLVNLGGEGSSSGGSGGDTNFIIDPNAAGGDIAKFVEYLNSGATPTNGIGGSAPNISFSKEETLPQLRMTGDWKITKSALNAQGEGISYDFDIEPGFVGRTLELTFNYITSVDYANNDIGVFIYDKTNSILVSTNANDVPQTMGKPGMFICKFPATSSSLRVIFHVRSTNTLAYTFSFSDLSVKPESKIIGAAIGDWQSYTPTLTGFGTLTNVSFLWKRVGDSIIIVGRFVAGTPTATPATFTLPSGLLIDTAKLPSSTISQSRLGIAHTSDAANLVWFNQGTDVRSHILIYNSPTVIGFSSFNSSTAGDFALQAIGTEISNINRANYIITDPIPIVGWSSNVNLIQNATEFAYNTDTTDSDNTTGFGYGPEGVDFGVYAPAAGTVRKKRVRFKQPLQITDKLEIEIQVNGFWQSLPVIDNQSANCSISHSVSTLDASNITYGMGLKIINSTDVDVNFGSSAFQWSGNDTGWNEIIAAGYKWRVRKSSGSVVAEVPPFVGAKYNATANAIASPSQPIQFTNKVYDTHNAVTIGSGWKFTAPVSGYYLVQSFGLYTDPFANFLPQLFMNGNLIDHGTDVVSLGRGGISTTLYLNVGDYIDLRAHVPVTIEASGSATYIAISKIG